MKSFIKKKKLYSPPIITKTRELTNDLSTNMLDEMGWSEAKIRKETDDFCKGSDYIHLRSCNNCFEASPSEIFSRFEKYGGVENLLYSPKNFEKEVKDLIKNMRRMQKKMKDAACGGLICSNYSKKTGEKIEGIIFAYEYYATLPIISKDGHISDFSLGTISYFGYGSWDGKEEGIFDKECRNNLGITPPDAVIMSLNLPQIMKKLKS